MRKIDDVSKKQVLNERKVLYKGHYYSLVFVPRQTQRISVLDQNILLPHYANIKLRQVVMDWMNK